MTTASGHAQTLGGTQIGGQGSIARERGLTLSRERSQMGRGITASHDQTRSPLSLSRWSARFHERADQRQTPQTDRADAKPTDQPTNRPERTTGNVDHLTGHERAMQVQLATVNRLRDRAVETGNQEWLDRADEMEQRIRARFAAESQPEEQPQPVSPDVPATASASVDATTTHGNSAFGQSIAASAKANGQAFGQFTSNQARTNGRVFGQTNAEKTRELPPLPPIREPDGDDGAPTTDDGAPPTDESVPPAGDGASDQ